MTYRFMVQFYRLGKRMHDEGDSIERPVYATGKDAIAAEREAFEFARKIASKPVCNVHCKFFKPDGFSFVLRGEAAAVCPAVEHRVGV